jgi:hypothetical protein
MLIVLCSFTSGDYIDDMNSGAIAYYMFENDADDETPNNNDGTPNSVTNVAGGIIGKTYDYDSASDYIDLNSPLIPASSDYSISGWINADDLSANMWITQYLAQTSTGRAQIGFVSNEAFVQIQPISMTSTPTTYNTNVWYHYVQTRSGNTFELFINTISKDTDTQVTTVATDTNTWLGRNFYGANINAFNGQIDEVALFDFALTQQQIDYLYNSGSPGSNQQYPFGAILVNNFTTLHISPNNNTINNTNLYNGYEVTDTTNTEINCYLYINSTINTTQFNITVNSTLYFNTTLGSDGDYLYYVSCSNGTISSNTSVYTYTYDTTQPFININSPNTGNTTTFNYNNRSLNLDITITDQHLYKGNLTIYNSSGSVMYNNYTGDLTGDTSWIWNSTLDLTTWESGFYSGFIEASDTHTAKSIKKGFSPIKETFEKIKYKTPKEWGDTEFSLEYIGDTKLISYEDHKKFDRHSIIAKFDKNKDKTGKIKENNKGFRWEEFYITSDKHLTYIENSDYPCHIVSTDGMRGLWFDCIYQDMGNDIQIVEKINGFEYKIKIYTDNEIIEFNSLGGLNNNNKSFSFNILENLTLFVNDTNTGLLINNFSVNYNSVIYTANGTNITIPVFANQSANITVQSIGCVTFTNSTFIGFNPVSLTVNLTSGGTIFNFYDEKTNSLITLQNVSVDVVGNVSGRFSTNTGSVTVSGLPTGNYTAVYFSSGYKSREYPINLNDTGLETIDLYLCNSSICEDIVINVFDTVGSGLTGYEVQVLRLIDGNYVLVEKGVSNFEGQAGISAITFEPSYKFIVLKNNIIKKTTEETEIYSNILNFYISEFEDIAERYIKLGNFQYILRYDETLKQFQLSYVDPSSSLSEVCLRVNTQTNYTEEILYNETCLNTYSGVININIVEQVGTIYIAKIYTSFSPEQYVDVLVKRFEDVLSDSKTGLWITLLLILMVGFMGVWFPSIAILLIAIVLWITKVLGLHQFGYSTITGVTVGCVIFSYIFAKYK